MGDTPGRISIGELHLAFPNVEATAEVINASADRLADYAREVASQSLRGSYEVVVVVSEGSLKEDVNLYISIAAFAVTVTAADYSAARKNLNWLANQAESFTETIADHETHSPQLPVTSGDIDRSVLVRRRTPALDGIRELLQGAEEVNAQKSSKARRAKLVEQVERVLRICESNEERRELLTYLSADPNVEYALREELGENYREEVVRRKRSRTRDDRQLRLDIEEIAVDADAMPTRPRVRRRVIRAVRRFTVTTPQ